MSRTGERLRLRQAGLRVVQTLLELGIAYAVAAHCVRRCFGPGSPRAGIPTERRRRLTLTDWTQPQTCMPEDIGADTGVD